MLTPGYRALVKSVIVIIIRIIIIFVIEVEPLLKKKEKRVGVGGFTFMTYHPSL